MQRERFTYWPPRSPWLFGIAGVLVGVLAAAAVVSVGRLREAPTPSRSAPISTAPATTEPESYTISGTLSVESAELIADFIAHQRGYSESMGDILWTRGRLRALKDLQAGMTFDCSEGLGGGYSDVHSGTIITVTDEAGTVIATGELGQGELSLEDGCKFTYEITSVPEAQFYKIEVTHRGGLTYSFDDMISNDWTISSTLSSY
jgi:hypothetical protein